MFHVLYDENKKILSLNQTILSDIIQDVSDKDLSDKATFTVVYLQLFVDESLSHLIPFEKIIVDVSIIEDDYKDNDKYYRLFGCLLSLANEKTRHKIDSS